MPARRPDRFLSGGRFGTASAEWTVYGDQSAAEVAAAWVQHRVAGRANELIAARTVTLSRLAASLGEQPENLRRKLTGSAQAGLADVLGWLLALGPHADEAFPRDAVSLLPPSHQVAARGWTPGQLDLPVFLPPAGGDATTWDWLRVAEDVHRVCEAEVRAGRERHLEEGLLRHSLVTSLDRLGIEPHRMFTQQRLPTSEDDAVDVDVVVGPGLNAGVVLVLLRRSDAQDASTQAQALSRATRRVLALGSSSLHTRLLVTVAPEGQQKGFNELIDWSHSDDALRSGRLGFEASVRLKGATSPATNTAYTSVELLELARLPASTEAGLGVAAFDVGKSVPNLQPSPDPAIQDRPS